MTRPRFHLDLAVARCLAHDEDDRPNGCTRSEDCQRHVAIRHDPVDCLRHISPRACQPGDHDKHIGIIGGGELAQAVA
jgi:hypothetical protein